MGRRVFLLAALAAGGGCVTPEDRKQWAEAVRDLHGDNMRMRAGSGADPARSAAAARGGDGAADRPPRNGPRRADDGPPPDRRPAAD